MVKIKSSVFKHKTAVVEKDAKIGANTKIWQFVHIRRYAVIGKSCNIGRGVYIDEDVVIGDCVKIHNYACIFKYCEIGSGVFIGPHVVITNDKYPRAINPNGTLKKTIDWQAGLTKIGNNASIGANSVVLPNVTIGEYALIGSGSVVTRNIHEFEVVVGNPAKKIGYACKCARQIFKIKPKKFPITCILCNKINS